MIMRSRYFPKVGDLVNYKNELMVIVRTEVLSIAGDHIAYLLNKELIENFKDFTETKELTSKCILLIYNTFKHYYPFTHVGTLPIEIEEVSYTKIKLKQ